jgi:UDP-glucose 4-epimerase
MNIHVLGSGPISLKLASHLSLVYRVNIYSNSEDGENGKLKLLEYKNFQKSCIEEDDIVIVAWRKLPEASDVRGKTLNLLNDGLQVTNLVVNLSSVSVYGNNFMVTDESSLTVPINTYGTQKLNLENYLNAHFSSKVLHLRISNVFGDYFFDDIVNRLIISVKHGKPVELNDPTRYIRDFLSINTVVESITKFVIKKDMLDKQSVFNVSSGSSFSVLRVMQLIEEVFQKQIQSQSKPVDSSVIEVSRVSNTKMLKFLSLKSKDELELMRIYLEEIALNNNPPHF